MNTYNLHGLFHASITDCLEDHISLTAQDRSDLVAARTAVRAHMRSQLPKRLKAARLEDVGDNIAPRFITQGSYAYDTLNAPARAPQQADLDDGVYVPLSFCEDTGSPRAVSRLLLSVVEETLRDLANQRRWEIDTSNDNCTRLIVAADKHIDVPIYSIPDREFDAIALRKHALARDSGSFNDYFLSEKLDDDWSVMPPRVRLAHKTKGWLDSDPRPIKEWVDRQVARKSEQLRRLMRYLKAWRDHQQWSDSDPKSILLMALTDAALDRKIEDRDDLSLLKVCAAVPSLVASGRVEIPPLPGENLLSRLISDGLKEEFVANIRKLHDVLQRCTQGQHSREETCRLLRDQFGTRFPNRPDRRRIEAPEQVVRASAPRVIAAAPIVGRREAG